MLGRQSVRVKRLGGTRSVDLAALPPCPSHRRPDGERPGGMMSVRRTDTDRITEERRSTTTGYNQQRITRRRQLSRRTATTVPDARGAAYMKLVSSPRQVFLILTLLSTSCSVGKLPFNLRQSLYNYNPKPPPYKGCGNKDCAVVCLSVCLSDRPSVCPILDRSS